MSGIPKVSFCVPTVNRLAFLREAIASVAGQTWRDFELVVADNSGDPEYHRHVDALLAEFPQLRVILRRHPTQVDVIDNFNCMIDAARGELWACLPDDDRACPNFLARSVAALDGHPECAFSFGDHWLLDSDGSLNRARSEQNSVRYGRVSTAEGVYGYPELFGLALRQVPCLQTALFRRSVIASLRFVPGIMCGDYSLFLRAAAAPERMSAYFINERLFEYRIHGSQISSTSARQDILRDQIVVLEALSDVPPRYRSDVKAVLSRRYLSLALLEAEGRDRRGGRQDADRALFLSPSVRGVLGALLVRAPVPVIKAVRQASTWKQGRSANVDTPP